MGAEDFAFYTQQIPGLLVRVGTRSSPETSHPVHDASFDLDERALAPTARLMAEALIRRGQQG
jgi:metal-dependent amidase/aminoacylase/carboxypeptidase family protein